MKVYKKFAVYVKAKFDFGYEAVGGWKTPDQQAKWEHALQLIKMDRILVQEQIIYWRLVEGKRPNSSEVLVADTTGCIYFHPEGFETVLLKDEYNEDPSYFPALKELNRILAAIARFVGGSYTIETKEMEI